MTLEWEEESWGLGRGEKGEEGGGNSFQCSSHAEAVVSAGFAECKKAAAAPRTKAPFSVWSCFPSTLLQYRACAHSALATHTHTHSLFVHAI